MKRVCNLCIFYAIFTAVLIGIIAAQEKATITIRPSNHQVVKYGEPFEFVCGIGRAIRSCRIGGPHFSIMELPPGRARSVGPKYAGRGTHVGDCGIRVEKSDASFDGQFRCVLEWNFFNQAYQLFNLTVAKPPRDIHLTVYSEYNHLRYKQGDVMQAKCTVNGSRPQAEITWYLGNTRITDGLGELHSTEDEELNDGLQTYTVSQELHRTVSLIDDNQLIRCETVHVALDSPLASIAWPIHVQAGTTPFQVWKLVAAISVPLLTGIIIAVAYIYATKMRRRRVQFREMQEEHEIDCWNPRIQEMSGRPNSRTKLVTGHTNPRTQRVNHANPRTQGVAGQGNPRTQGVAGQGNPRTQGVAGQGNPRPQGVADQGNPLDQGVAGQGNPLDQGVAGEENTRPQGVADQGTPPAEDESHYEDVDAFFERYDDIGNVVYYQNYLHVNN